MIWNDNETASVVLASRLDVSCAGYDRHPVGWWTRAAGVVALICCVSLSDPSSLSDLRGRRGSGNKGGFGSGQYKTQVCSAILEDGERNPLFVTLEYNCNSLSSKEHHSCTSNSFVDYRLPCAPLTAGSTVRRLWRGLGCWRGLWGRLLWKITVLRPLLFL